MVVEALFILFLTGTAADYPEEALFQENRRLAKTMVDTMQDPRFGDEILFDLKKDNQIYLNRTMAIVIKYIVKREVDTYRQRRTDAISRRVYSALIMKLIDIAKDLPRNTSASSRIETAHRYYVSVENRDLHDQMADNQVFHLCTRLYDILYTAPKILTQLGNVDELTPRLLTRKLAALELKPVHLGVALLLQYHLRSTINFALRTNTLEILSTKPQEVGSQVMAMLRGLAAKLLPIAELLDIHLAHYSPVFRDKCPSTWLGIVNNKES